MNRQQLASALVEHYETPVSLEAYAQRFAAAPSDEEVEDMMELVRWFRRRYPTAKERFAYIRRKYAEWTRCPPTPIESLTRQQTRPIE